MRPKRSADQEYAPRIKHYFPLLPDGANAASSVLGERGGGSGGGGSGDDDPSSPGPSDSDLQRKKEKLKDEIARSASASSVQ